MIQLQPEDEAALTGIVLEMQTAWNAGDAAGFAAVFLPSGDQVNIFAAHLRGREEIERRHRDIFETLFRASRNALTVIDARYIQPDVILAHVRSDVRVPEGPLSGTLRTLASLVLQRIGSRWAIVTFHNTREGVAGQE